MLDDVLLQEIYSLREKIKIITTMLKTYEPDLDVSMFLHSLGHGDYQEWVELCNDDKEAIHGLSQN